LLKVSLFCWCISLALPALIASKTSDLNLGIGILLTGWLGFAGVENGVNFIAILAWWANPVFLIAYAKLSDKHNNDTITPHVAVFFGLLTFLLSSYAINAVPSFTKVIGYGPGVIFWIASLLLLGYSSSLSNHLKILSRIYMAVAFIISLLYLSQIYFRYSSSNQSEKDILPAYAAKRGKICSLNALPLKIQKQESIIEIDTIDTNEWITTIHNYGVDKIQAYGQQYRAFNDNEKGSLETRTPPYMHKEKIGSPARYLLKIEGNHPYKFWKGTGRNSIRMIISDTKEHKVIGELIHHPDISTGNYCPTLPTYSSPQEKNNEEVIKWLAPFISKNAKRTAL
jgi:hypothetical protein